MSENHNFILETPNKFEEQENPQPPQKLKRKHRRKLTIEDKDIWDEEDFENTINGNTINGNTINENTISENTINENTISKNTINKNTISENTISENTINELDTPSSIFIKMINIQKQKEENSDIWKDSQYKDLVKLQSNNSGNVGELFIQKMCNACGIQAKIDGTKTKELGGGIGDGKILNKSVEIKTAHRGCKTPNFQHELGEKPWHSLYMMFIDVEPNCIYLTIFKNYDEEFYKSGAKCHPYFPTKSVTWRKRKGAFKLDTTVKINKDNIIKKNTFKIDNTIKIDELKTFILSKIEVEFE